MIGDTCNIYTSNIIFKLIILFLLVIFLSTSLYMYYKSLNNIKHKELSER